MLTQRVQDAEHDSTIRAFASDRESDTSDSDASLIGSVYSFDCDIHDIAIGLLNEMSRFSLSPDSVPGSDPEPLRGFVSPRTKSETDFKPKWPGLAATAAAMVEGDS